MIYKLSKEYVFEKETYTEFEVPIDDLSGAQLKNFKKKFAKINKISKIEQTPVAIIWDEDFCLYIASELTGYPLELFEGLPAGDYIGLVSQIQSFLSPSASTSV